MTDQEIKKTAQMNNPAYRGATPEMVGRALLRPVRKTGPKVKAAKKAPRRSPEFQSSISFPSNRPSPRSNTGCATLRNARSTTHGGISEDSSIPSNPRNAETTSETPDMDQTKTDTL